MSNQTGNVFQSVDEANLWTQFVMTRAAVQGFEVGQVIADGDTLLRAARERAAMLVAAMKLGVRPGPNSIVAPSSNN